MAGVARQQAWDKIERKWCRLRFHRDEHRRVFKHISGCAKERTRHRHGRRFDESSEDNDKRRQRLTGCDGAEHPEGGQHTALRRVWGAIAQLLRGL